jgi:hypothetical protein
MLAILALLGLRARTANSCGHAKIYDVPVG